MYRVTRNEEERLTYDTKTSLAFREYSTILVAIQVHSSAYIYFYSVNFRMVLHYNDDLLLNNEQFNFLCQALAENLSISNLPEASEDVPYLFSFAMFLTPIFDEI